MRGVPLSYVVVVISFKMNKQKTVFLKLPNAAQEIELAIIEGTNAPSAVDVRSLYKSTGYFTYDPGFMSTASCDSSITYIDGENAIL